MKAANIKLIEEAKARIEDLKLAPLSGVSDAQIAYGENMRAILLDSLLNPLQPSKEALLEILEKLSATDASFWLHPSVMLRLQKKLEKKCQNSQKGETESPLISPS